jgi:hypothetical protein
LEHCLNNDVEPLEELKKPYERVVLKIPRVLEDGSLETEKQARVRKMLELAEYNKAAKVLRRQAKQVATEAGLRKHAELTGRI